MDITEFFVSQREEAFLGGGHDDYRAQNSRRIHTLRRRIGIATPKGRKYAAKPSVTVDDVAKNPEYVHLLLLDAERSWAAAMSMKEARVADSANEAITGSTRSQIISRLNKAAIHAENLVKILQEWNTKAPDGSQSLLEAQAYASYLRGSLYFEKGSWEACLKSYAVARVIYVALASRTKKDIFKDLLSNTIDPSIRYAAYQSKLPRTKPVSEVAIEYFPSEHQDIKAAIESIQPEAFTPPEKIAAEGGVTPQTAASTLKWRSRTVKVEDAAISEAIVAAESAESKLPVDEKSFDQDQLMTLYDEIINARQEVVDVTKTAIDELIKEGVEQSDSRIQSLQITRTAVNYALIEWRVGRDRILCGANDGIAADGKSTRAGQKKKSKTGSGITMASLRKTVALYDAILQSLGSVRDLPGVAGDSEFVQELTGKASYFRAARCLAIGRSHAIQSNLPNALALFIKAHELSSTALTSIKSPSGGVAPNAPKLDISKTQLQNFHTYLQNLVIQYRAMNEIHKLSGPKDADSEKSVTIGQQLTKHLDQYPDIPVDLTNLVVYPPTIEPIPVKPLFFDLAWNHIDYPGRTSSISKAEPETRGAPAAQPAPTAASEKKKGWFGFGR